MNNNICSNQNCNTVLSGKQRKFCSSKCKSQSANARLQDYTSQKIRGTNRKKELVLMKGGKCSSCGYDKNLAGLCFHHLDTSKKDFTLDMRSLSNKSMNSILSELEKCVLLCHNCHMEHHYPDLNHDWK